VTVRIVVIGSVNTDLVVFADRAPGPGETLAARDFALLPGGKGANQAVAASRCGADVSLVGRVGRDAFGASARAALGAAGIDLAQLRDTDGVASGIASIVVEASGENRILIVAGANGCVTPLDLPDLAEAAMVVLQLEIPVETVYAAIARSVAAGVPAILNPAPAAALDLARLRGLAYLVPNRGELATLTGRGTERFDDVVAAARRLVRQGIGAVIVTLGADGAVLVTERRVAHVEAPPVMPVDTTGAGDAFIGCFAAMLVRSGDEDMALATAVRYASDTVTRRGAQASYPPMPP
jgi:ribokinase